MIKIDEVQYEPTFYDWIRGKWTNKKKMKRKWCITVGGYYALGKTKELAYKKAKKLYDEWSIADDK